MKEERKRYEQDFKKSCSQFNDFDRHFYDVYSMKALKIATVATLGATMAKVVVARKDKKNEVAGTLATSAACLIFLAVDKGEVIREMIGKGAKGAFGG